MDYNQFLRQIGMRGHYSELAAVQLCGFALTPPTSAPHRQDSDIKAKTDLSRADLSP